jgi:hypothetical protein
VFVIEVTVSVVRNETEEECLILSVERPVVHSENWLDWVQTLNIGVYPAIVPTDNCGVQVL